MRVQDEVGGMTIDAGVAPASTEPPGVPDVDGWEEDVPQGIDRTRRVLEDVFGPVSARSFTVRYWDGTKDAPAAWRPSDFELVLRHPGALRRGLLPPTDRRMGEAYVRGYIDIEGDVEAAAALVERLKKERKHPHALVSLLAHAARLPRQLDPSTEEEPEHYASDGNPKGVRHSRARDAAAVRRHYDVGNDFFRIFLDSRLVYSCAYFARGSETLDEAQEAKLDLICRKLRLSEGDRLLDIGCGWGSLVEFAASRYGVQATGITLSPPQAEFARKRIADAGLADRCTIEVRDYRDLGESSSFEKVASVGMVEHVGRANLPVYFEEVERVLAPGGLFLNHGIVSLGPSVHGVRRLGRRWLASHNSFIQRFVFPDSELVSPSDVIRPGELAGLELRDVESLREHYATTLRHWVRRLEAGKGRAVREVGEETYRVWRLYMAGSAHMFASGRIGIIQALWGKPYPSGLLSVPPRETLYEASAVA
ncbi:MAG: class I SAM-dependent methyltransferase [Gemmatimonadota bacterium]|nr:MAG: class I SAM-dependent methyltransferase [Gemmatimonadota bacterium]